MAKIDKNTAAKFTERKLHVEQLRFSNDHNARSGDDPKAWTEGDEDDHAAGGSPMPVLMATIEAVGGLILPLIVVDLKKKDGQGRSLFSVAAGKRRTTALLSLWKAKRLADPMVVCREVEQFDPMMISLIENVARQPMHPADECIAFAKLVDKGQGVEGVAAAFAVDVKHVRRCLALAMLHPELMAAFRARKFGMDVAKAFTCEPDQARQLAAWKKLPAYQKANPHYIRQALTAQDLRAADRMAKFVGVEVYTAAGGELREDVFATDERDNTILVDPGLVESLAAAKLEDKAVALVEQGWSWGEVVQEAHSYEVDRVAAARGLQRVDARGADRTKAGYFVHCDQSGSMQINGPYMPKKEARAHERKKGGAAASEGVAVEAKVPDSLMNSLTAHKSAALQVALLKTPRVALALLAANVVSDFYDRQHLNVRFENQGHRIASLARGYEDTKPSAALAEADASWESRIPEGTEPFAWFLDQPEAVALEAIVWGTARCFSIINGRDGTPEGVGALQQALAFNLADHFKPTVDTYLGQVPMAKIVSDVTEALGAQVAATLAGMKKGVMAVAAEAKLAEAPWVPEAIR
jgi:ParB family transcriptional regulator, chromosome partitioning protein